MSKKISVIVPVKTATEEFSKHIQSLLAIDYPDFDIIIVDDGMDRYPQIFEQHKQKIKVIKSEGKGPSFARNLAARQTEAEYIAFTDSDCLVSPQWLRELFKGFEEFPQAVSCGGAQELPSDSSFFEKKVFSFLKTTSLIAEYVKKNKKEITEVNHNASCNVMYKREVFLAQGGFLEGLWPAEDVELDYRLRKTGQCLVYNPKAIVYHYRPKNIRAFCSMMYRYGLAQAILVKKYGIFRKIQALPLIILSGIIVSVILFLKNIFLAGIFLLLLAGLSIVFFSFDLALLILVAAATLFWNWGFLCGLFRKKV